MKEEHLLKLFELFKFKRVRRKGDWLMCSCPFAFKHEKGTDNSPSFGVSASNTSSAYHCFSCHTSGRLIMLPSSLLFATGKTYPDAQAFLLKHERLYDLEDYSEIQDESGPLVAPALNENIYKAFPPVKGKVWGLEESRFDSFDLRYDSEELRLLFPVRDINGRLVGIRGRYLGNREIEKKYREYSELFSQKKTGGLKHYGIWYGMGQPLSSGKFLVLVEGERDRIMLMLAGIKNVWAAMGATITQEQINTLKQVNLPIIVFFDNDKAGKDAKDKVKLCLGKVKILHAPTFYGTANDPADVVTSGLLSKVMRSVKPL